MNAIKRLLFSMAALSLVGLACAKPLDDKARDLLLRALQRAFNVNVRAICVQYCSENDTLQQVKIEQTQSGTSRYTILAPLRDQGVESIDDGNRAITFLPDSKLVLIQPSSRSEALNAKERLALAEKNYKFSIEKSAPIAGRKAVCVVAKPKTKALEERRYYIDSETAYLLRAETVSGRGDKHLKYDTRCVSYPTDMGDPGLSIDAFGSTTKRFEKLIPITRAQDCASVVGFMPLIPARLPYGFVVSGSQITKSENWKAVVVRVSDGLVRGAVYQWKIEGSSEGQEGAPDRSCVDANGIRLLMVADMPRTAREKVLQSFALLGDRSTRWDPAGTREPSRAFGMFNNLGGLRSSSYIAPIAAD